jgi:hypothetical protein
MLIAHQAEVDGLIDAMGQTPAETRAYLVLGTLDMKTWRRGLSGGITVEALREHMADFKEYVRIDYTPGDWDRSARP